MKKKGHKKFWCAVVLVAGLGTGKSRKIQGNDLAQILSE